MTFTDFQLGRDPHGHLVYTGADGQAHVGVVPVRAFPLSAPDEGVSIVSPDGHELAWIEQLSALPAALARVLRDELASRDFVPVITRLVGHYPGERLGFAGREAGGLMRDWSRTVRRGRYADYGETSGLEAAMARVSCPTLGVHFEHDALVPEPTLHHLLEKRYF